jgi:hypothetical protein
MENVGFTGEGNMAVTRRGLGHLAFAGAVAFGASTSLLRRQSLAKATDQAAVDQAVEALRKALLDRDVDRLRDLLVDIESRSKRIVAESAICWNSASYKSGRSRTTSGGF